MLRHEDDKNNSHFTTMLWYLKRPRRTYSKVAVSLLVLMWICAFLYNNTHIYFTLRWKEQTFNYNDLNTKNTTKMELQELIFHN